MDTDDEEIDETKHVWEGDMQGLRVRVYADGSTAYRGTLQWHRTRESLLNQYDVPVVVALAAEVEDLRKRLARQDALSNALRARAELLQAYQGETFTVDDVSEPTSRNIVSRVPLKQAVEAFYGAHAANIIVDSTGEPVDLHTLGYEL
ncbi:hypothetical protein EKK58_05535 [Candidatus Dependentiae bacterium]|nr:MAG: hypothetical protein EKK58_05535 [Candidatus Dependentiae bacterium]